MKKEPKWLSLIFCGAFAALLIGFGVWVSVKAPSRVSYSERRELSAKPALTVESVTSGKYFTAAEKYLLDQFPLRDTFRRIKAVCRRSIFRQTDDHGIVLFDGSAVQIETPTEKDVGIFFKRLKRYEEIGGESAKNVSFYTTLIPDKMAFIREEIGYPTVDYDALRDRLSAEAPGAYIDIFDLLSLDDYYRTDTHWKQERITDVADALLAGMGAETNGKVSFSEPLSPFYGVYYGQSALPLEPDEITLVHSDVIDGAKVFRANRNSTGFDAASVYAPEKMTAEDSYDVYLGGLCTVTVLENPLSESGKTLALFSDSFGRSLAPLLLAGYDRIVIYDARYMSLAGMLSLAPLPDGADVLFAYSISTVDSADTLFSE